MPVLHGSSSSSSLQGHPQPITESTSVHFSCLPTAQKMHLPRSRGWSPIIPRTWRIGGDRSLRGDRLAHHTARREWVGRCPAARPRTRTGLPPAPTPPPVAGGCPPGRPRRPPPEIGRASCREREENE